MRGNLTHVSLHQCIECIFFSQLDSFLRLEIIKSCVFPENKNGN